MANSKPFLLITGMHRSGTSFLARSLNLMGVYLGDFSSLVSTDWFYYKENPRGHWENEKLLELGKKSLTFDSLKGDKIKPINEELGNQIRDYTDELIKHPSLASGFKDPYLLEYLETWLQYLPKNFIIVGIFRDPLKVAESLKKQSGYKYQSSIAIWKMYNEKLLGFLERFDGFLLNFDWDKERILSEIKDIAEKIGLSADIDLLQWYSRDLLRSNNDHDRNYELPLDIKSLHSKLIERSNMNHKVSFQIPERDVMELTKVISGLLSDAQAQGGYFKKLNDSNVNTIKDQINELKNLDFMLKKAVANVDTLQKINLEHQKIKEDQVNKINHFVSEIGSLQKINLELHKTIEDQVKKINQLVSENKLLQKINMGNQKIPRLWSSLRRILHKKSK